jgi:hypothetical protein
MRGLPSRGRGWPGERDRLLLQAGLLDGEPAAQAWEAWKRVGGGLDGLDESSFRMLPLVYRNLARNGCEVEELPRLKGIYRYRWASNQRLFNCAGGALEALATAGIETMVLKGLALAVLHYRDVGVRPMVDVDVLVPTRSAEKALDALMEAGWSHVPGVGAANPLRTRHATPIQLPDGSKIDLHGRLLPEAAQDDDVWEAAMPVEVGGVSTLAPSATDQLLHVCVHGFSSSPIPLRWVADAVTVTRQAGDAIDWDRLVERAIARRVTLPLRPALALLRDEFGVPVPDDAVAALGKARATRSERLGHRVALHPLRRGTHYVVLFDRYRRLRRLAHDSPVPGGYRQFLAEYWGISERPSVIARKALQVAGRGTWPGPEDHSRAGPGA